MNWNRAARAALAGISPHQSSKRVRRLQSRIVMALFSHEADRGDRQVSEDTWKYLEIRRKAGLS